MDTIHWLKRRHRDHRTLVKKIKCNTHRHKIVVLYLGTQLQLLDNAEAFLHDISLRLYFIAIVPCGPFPVSIVLNDQQTINLIILLIYWRVR